MDKLLLRDLHLHQKKILMRVDFNVPIDGEGMIADASRITATLPTIRHILREGGALILMSHLGRPKGKKNLEYSLLPCAKKLGQLLHLPIKMALDCIGPEVEKLAQDLKPGEILLLENLRFHAGEEAPDQHPDFVKSLARLADIADYYVNDAFGAAHRFHTSTASIAQYFPGKAATGFLLEKEILFFEAMMKDPERPLCALVGGAKISTKMGALLALLDKVDALLIGGGMAYTFFKAQGIHIGNSLFEETQIPTAHRLLKESQERGIPLLLPIDVIITEKIEPGAHTKICEIKQGIPEGWSGVDIGPKTIELFRNELLKAKTIFWNGPVGIFEIQEFSKGTIAVAEILSKVNATTIIGGGDSLAAVTSAGVAEKMSHLSTGGGAILEYLEYGKLPGIEALSVRNNS